MKRRFNREEWAELVKFHLENSNDDCILKNLCYDGDLSYLTNGSYGIFTENERPVGAICLKKEDEIEDTPVNAIIMTLQTNGFKERK